MHPNLEVFGQRVPSYTVLILLGYLAGFVVAARRRERYGLSVNELLGIYLMGGVGAFLGGKTFYAIQGLPQFLWQHAALGISFMTYYAQAGLVFYGGLAGSILCAMLAARFTLAGTWRGLDCVLPSLPLSQAFGRVGCLLAGCCHGLPCDIGFYMSPESGGPHDVRLFPIQLVESGCCLAIFLLLLCLSRKNRTHGFLLGAYLLSYGCARFTLEFFRGDAVRGFIGPLSVSQWCSIVAVCIAVWLLVRAHGAVSEENPAPEPVP